MGIADRTPNRTASDHGLNRRHHVPVAGRPPASERIAGLLRGNPRLTTASELPDRRPCPRCHSTEVIETVLDRGPHRARLSCGECGRWLRFAPAPKRPPEPPASKCPGCDAEVIETPLAAVPGFASKRCAGCGTKFGISRETPGSDVRWARSFRIKSGRNAGKTLGELAMTLDGLSVLNYLASEGVGDIRRAASFVLGSMVRG